MPRTERHHECKRNPVGHWLTLYVREPATRKFINVGHVCRACRKLEFTAHFESGQPGSTEITQY